MLILVDQDGPLANWEAGFAAAWRTSFPDLPHVAVEDRREWNIESEYPAEVAPLISEIQSAPGFYRGLPVVDGAVEALEGLVADGHDVRICSAPAARFANCVAEKFHWVEQHFGERWVPRIILARDKTWVRGDVLIDDNPEVTGALNPVWTHVVYDTPTNAGVPGPRLTWGTHREVLDAFEPGSAAGPEWR
ncbi:MAG TPA: hypothetical protein VML96_00975 [Egibacteraceae bacterium]|nr:hypothetical protein [Egibacteraceae bacterium]